MSTDADGTDRYATIASAAAIKGQWVQLANTSFNIPEGAENLTLLVETADITDNFYIDGAIGAEEGTVIDGVGVPVTTVRGNYGRLVIMFSFENLNSQNYLINIDLFTVQFKPLLCCKSSELFYPDSISSPH